MTGPVAEQHHAAGDAADDGGAPSGASVECARTTRLPGRAAAWRVIASATTPFRMVVSTVTPSHAATSVRYAAVPSSTAFTMRG